MSDDHPEREEGDVDIMDIPRRWLTSKEAACYCALKDHGYFLRLAKKYGIPRHGPSRRAFDIFELDQWMHDERCFLPDQTRSYRKQGGFTPVHHMLSQQPPGEDDEQPEPQDHQDDHNATDDKEELWRYMELRKRQGVVKL